MAKRITGDVTVSVTTTAQDVDIRFRDFLLVNNSEATVFFREKAKDGEAVTAPATPCRPRARFPTPSRQMCCPSSAVHPPMCGSCSST